MRVLVAVASRHGATQDIAATIAAVLRDTGIEAELPNVEDVRDVAGFDAVVLGSAIYMGNGLPEARAFVEQHQHALSMLPLWLFSSGPLGAGDPQPQGDPVGAMKIVAVTHPREHHIFAGRLDKTSLGLRERLATRVVHAPEGDFRDWDAIRNWAGEIAASLQAMAAI